MKLTAEATVRINGVEVTFAKGTEVQFPLDDRDAVLQFKAITKLPVDLGYTENGVTYVEGGGGKFVAVEGEPKKATKPKETPKAKATAKKKSEKTKAS